MSTRISIDYTQPLIISEDEAKEKIADLVELNRSTMQDIKTKIDDYGSPLPHKQTDRPLEINERTKLFDRMSIDLTSNHTEQLTSLD
ncbi:hypothetical protein G6F52_012006 [Rhizopus delemar]|nr:hypothetical protein G6F52_012006 [Rhizopus delemar]KAG1631752.1 hypothetical protein G6F44_010924 [Rhizopus delemar]